MFQATEVCIVLVATLVFVVNSTNGYSEDAQQIQIEQIEGLARFTFFLVFKFIASVLIDFRGKSSKLVHLTNERSDKHDNHQFERSRAQLQLLTVINQRSRPIPNLSQHPPTVEMLAASPQTQRRDAGRLAGVQVRPVSKPRIPSSTSFIRECARRTSATSLASGTAI